MGNVGRMALGWWVVAVAGLSLVGCSNVEQAERSMGMEVQISPAEWDAMIRKRVVFAHQSVGQNILDGVALLADRDGAKVQIVTSRTPPPNGGIAHFPAGQNGDPSSKLIDFTATMQGGAGDTADIAFVKLCYIDFSASTDARSLAEQYIAALDRLSLSLPNTTFVAVTAPLTVAQTGPKAWIKRILGREPSGYGDNARRQEFNELLRARYERFGLLFDLARIEADGAGDTRYQGRLIEVLNPALTYDDGHLTREGSSIIAARLVKYLASVPGRRTNPG